MAVSECDTVVIIVLLAFPADIGRKPASSATPMTCTVLSTNETADGTKNWIWYL